MTASLTATPRDVVAFPRWTRGRGLWTLVALHAPFVAAGPMLVIPRHDVGVAGAVGVTLIAVAIGALHLRVSLAASRGEQVAAGPLIFVAVAALVYFPLPWFTWDWAGMQWFVIASGATMLRGWLAALTVVAPIVAQTFVVGWYIHDEPGTGAGLLVVGTIYHGSVLVMGAAALYGSAWLARVLADLYAARTELAELAVGRERLRVSRDLHDVLGQSLSAVALKGDLALRLLPGDGARARAEIESLTEVARETLRDVRAVTRDEHRVSLPAEVDAAVALLEAAGIATSVDVDARGLSVPVDEALAWAVREGATNVLRHSTASVWSVSVARRGGVVRLEIVNDGAPEPSGHGTGIAGLVVRAQALDGAVSAVRAPDGQFNLSVTIPEEAP